MNPLAEIKQKIRLCRNSNNPVIRAGVKPIYLLRSAFHLTRFFTDADFRGTTLMQIFNPGRVHQTTSLTCMNRYPEIFTECQKYLGEKANLKILSYGCSTGEEVLTLRYYFPPATIIGAELNRRSLAICRKQPIDPRTSFIYSTVGNLAMNGPYDAIFCMAVLQRRPGFIADNGVASLKKIYPFERFERQIKELDTFLKPQGLLIIHHTQYSFMDTSIAHRYEPYGETAQDNKAYPVFDKNSELRVNPAKFNSIYLKQSMN